jgi:hypothetical protein
LKEKGEDAGSLAPVADSFTTASRSLLLYMVKRITSSALDTQKYLVLRMCEVEVARSGLPSAHVNEGKHN